MQFLTSLAWIIITSHADLAHAAFAAANRPRSQVLKQLQTQIDKLSAAMALNAELTLRFKTLEASLLLCNREEHWLRSNVAAQAPKKPKVLIPLHLQRDATQSNVNHDSSADGRVDATATASTSKPAAAAAAAGSEPAAAATEAASGSPITGPLSFAALPHPDTWDEHWVRRVAAFSSEDLCTLHAQYAAAAALLYPKAETFGPTSPQHMELLRIHDRYMCFIHR